ncbi:molybdopterin-dependent oxidoreductase [Aggregicoccus sp. 17bor-14]|uniref:molybdopterin oxidoreductase family protein n=1 Tax=Myxococcaceae TaxID=31 RepID=UPI00129C4E7A|nr:MULTISPECIES: molybdopterin oxidoreductase family protein [Myxococcaceae]MBF5040964.1 molybdopterin oxidoreductase family protein [Simulacricoccus sp. 17bor-14]MRI86752.1 molybdopterin-dependent oxidoreductase [Aggregicoccus sp. 17bor-14]
MAPSRAARTHFRTCNLCEAMCGVRIDVEEVDGAERVKSIRGDDADPFSRGHICPKAVALKDLHEDPDRQHRPLRRTATGWEELGWEAALDEAASRLHAVQQQHGRDAVATYLGNPTVHNHGAMLFGPLLLRTLRTRNGFSATSVDQLPHMLAAHLMLGHQLLIPIPDIDRTHYFLALGANPLASNGSLMTAPDVKGRLRGVQARGGKVVVVDPRRTETAHAADEHLFIRPGTDALFLFALLREVLASGPRLHHLEGAVVGLDALRAAASEFTPERVAPYTGIPPEQVRRIASELLAAPSAVVYGRVGTSTQAFGSLCHWLINALNVVSGNMDRPGGAMFTRPAFDIVGGPRALASSRGGFGRWKSRVRGLPEFGGELPVAALAEEVLTPGEGRIRALLTFAGNPVLSTPNGGQLERALGALDFMVSVDPYLNETTRHAHLILPPTTPLERGHYDIAFHALAVRNTAKYSPPLFEKPAGAMHDWEILLGLQERLERLRHGRSLARAAKHRALRRLGPEGILAVGLRFGPYGAGRNPLKRGLGLSTLRKAPHGVDLGPLQPCLPGRLATRDRRVQLAPEPFLQDVARLRAAFPETAGDPLDGQLLLIGRRHVRDNNSWMHNVPKLVSGKARCTLMLHPKDAQARGLAEGALARVRSRVGEVTVPVQVTDEVMRGVVSLPHGYGHTRPGVKAGVAVQHAGVSVNDLTDDQAVDALSGNAAFSGVPVHVQPA